MAPRYLGLLFYALLGLSLLGTAGYVYWRVQEPLAPLGIAHLPRPVPVPGIDEETRQQLRRLETRLPRLAAPVASGSRESPDLSIFGYQPVVDPAQRSARGEVRGATPGAYRVTMAIVGGRNRYCVVDGHFYREGEALPDGALVV